MQTTFKMEDRSTSTHAPYPGTLQTPVHYPGGLSPNLSWVYNDPGMHAYYNPPSGSIITKSASWPPAVAQALGYDPPPQLALVDPTWWDDMEWYANAELNKTHPPMNKTTTGMRYWDWQAKYPNTYPTYKSSWPNDTWNGAAWPSHLYGTLPSAWGDISPTTGKANLPNLRIM